MSTFFRTIQKDICLHIKLNIPEISGLDKVHAHLIIKDTLGLLPFRIYLKDIPKQKELFNWIKNQPHYDCLGQAIELISINNDPEILHIDFSESKLGLVTDLISGKDDDGIFMGVGFKSIVVHLKQNTVIYDGNYISRVYLNNHAYDLIHSITPIDSFEADEKIWSSKRDKLEINYGEVLIDLDFQENMESNSGGYPEKMIRNPRMTLVHSGLDISRIRKYNQVLCSAISFAIGNKVRELKISSNSQESLSVYYKPSNTKEKILRKDLGRFGINKHVLELFEELSPSLIEESHFAEYLVDLLNTALKLDGTDSFMLLFTVVEKLRQHLLGKKSDEEKFKFDIGKKAINTFIREKLHEIKDKVKEEQRDLFEKIIDGKLRTIKFLPQKDQFNKLFEILGINPAALKIDWAKIVDLRGDIVHGLYIDPEDKEMIEINRNLTTLVGHIIYKYLTSAIE